VHKCTRWVAVMSGAPIIVAACGSSSKKTTATTGAATRLAGRPVARRSRSGPFDTIVEVAGRANATNYGWPAACGPGTWPRRTASPRRSVPPMWVNTYNLFDPAVPFGGYKMSGRRREMGPDALDEYLNTKAVWVVSAPFLTNHSRR
jgi:hypothetical protein